MAKKKQQNALVRYFVPFGIKQLSDILMLAASIILIVGLCIYEKLPVLIVVGLAIFIVGALLSLVKSVAVMRSANRRSPEYKNAIASLVIVIIMLVIAVFGIVWYFI
ncbi:MAG: hypothetical protein IJD07_03840 [Clostridia bacterium]|nr:hypothetical protein [Clostridia bacterium]